MSQFRVFGVWEASTVVDGDRMGGDVDRIFLRISGQNRERERERDRSVEVSGTAFDLIA